MKPLVRFTLTLLLGCLLGSLTTYILTRRSSARYTVSHSSNGVVSYKVDRYTGRTWEHVLGKDGDAWREITSATTTLDFSTNGTPVTK